MIDKLYSKIKRVDSKDYPLNKNKKKAIEGLLKTSFSTVFVYDYVQQKVVYSKCNLLHSMGYEPQEFQEVSFQFFRKILHPEDVDIVNKHIQKINNLEQGKVLKCLFRLKSKDGNCRTIALRTTVLFAKRNGDPHHLMMTMLDVSRYKALKIGMARNKKVLNDLSYRISHDLRGPLATIKGLLLLFKYDLDQDNYNPDMIDLLDQSIHKMDFVLKDFELSLDTDQIVRDLDCSNSK